MSQSYNVSSTPDNIMSTTKKAQKSNIKPTEPKNESEFLGLPIHLGKITGIRMIGTSAGPRCGIEITDSGNGDRLIWNCDLSAHTQNGTIGRSELWNAFPRLMGGDPVLLIMSQRSKWIGTEVRFTIAYSTQLNRANQPYANIRLVPNEAEDYDAEALASLIFKQEVLTEPTHSPAPSRAERVPSTEEQILDKNLPA